MRRVAALRNVLERPLVVALVAIAALVATVLVTLSANASIARAREEVRRHAAMLDVARARSAEGVGATAPLDVADTHASIERVLRGRGIAFRRIASDGQPDEATAVVIEALPFDALVGVLDALAREGRVRPIEANISARVEPGVVRAELRLTR
ncbi:MAG TPA: type II secretion system protein GspM [Casimicrobiaceae bacterium]